MQQKLPSTMVKKFDAATESYRWSGATVDHLSTVSLFREKGRAPQSTIGFAVKSGLKKVVTAFSFATTAGLAGSAGFGFIDRVHQNTPANEVRNFLSFPSDLFSTMRSCMDSPMTIDKVMGYGGAATFAAVGGVLLLKAGQAVVRNSLLEETKRRAVVTMMKAGGHFSNLPYAAALNDMRNICAGKLDDPEGYRSMKRDVKTVVAETCDAHPDIMNVLNKSFRNKSVRGAKAALGELQARLQK